MTEKVKKSVDFKKHIEIKEYERKAKERVIGSAKHENRFSLNSKFIEDNDKIFDVLSKLSDHVSNLEERIAILETAPPTPPIKK